MSGNEGIDNDRLELVYQIEHDEDGLWALRECVICQAETHLRWGVCYEPVCHLHADCPNGCESPNSSQEWKWLR